MKKISLVKCFSIFSISLSCQVFCQVALGKASVSNSSVSLEFADTEPKGLILPWVTSTTDVTGAVNGTLVFDTSDKKAKVKLVSGWKDLSLETNGAVNTSLQDPITENSKAKVTVGTPSSTPGILVLEDSSKAMILPKVVNPHLNIINPSPGMMVYDTVSKLLCFFNGSVWTFWKY